MSRFIDTLNNEVSYESLCSVTSCYEATCLEGFDVSSDKVKKVIEAIWKKIVEAAKAVYEKGIELIGKIKEFLEPLRELIFDKEFKAEHLHFEWDTMHFTKYLKDIDRIWVQLMKDSREGIETDVIVANLQDAIDRLAAEVDDADNSYTIRAVAVAENKIKQAEIWLDKYREAVDKMQKEIHRIKFFKSYNELERMKRELGQLAVKIMINLQDDIINIRNAIIEKTKESRKNDEVK